MVREMLGQTLLTAIVAAPPLYVMLTASSFRSLIVRALVLVLVAVNWLLAAPTLTSFIDPEYHESYLALSAFAALVCLANTAAGLVLRSIVLLIRRRAG